LLEVSEGFAKGSAPAGKVLAQGVEAIYRVFKGIEICTRVHLG